MLLCDVFDLLVDRALFRAGWRAHMGRVLAADYGGDPAAWLAADDAIRADWDSYYADLDLGGEDALDHLYEGMYRVTRALFRLTGTPEPAPPALTALARTLPGRVAAQHDAVIPAARAWWIAQREPVGLVTGLTAVTASGILRGAGLSAAVIIGVETVERFVQDAEFYQRAAGQIGRPPVDLCLIDPDPAYRAAAASVGWRTRAALSA